MASGFLRKGALCLAFAAVARGGLTGCKPKPPGQNIDYDQPIEGMTQPQLHLRHMALDAELFQVRTEHYAKQLKSKKITQAEFDEVVATDNFEIARLRQNYVGTPGLPYFDGFFNHALTKGGFTPPAKMPELPKDTTQPTAQPTTQPSTQPSTQPAAKPGTPKV